MQEGKRRKKTTATIQQSCFLPLHELGSHPCSLDGRRRKGDFDETKTLERSCLRQRRKAHKKSVCFRGMPLREIPGDSGKKGGNFFSARKFGLIHSFASPFSKVYYSRIMPPLPLPKKNLQGGKEKKFLRFFGVPLPSIRNGQS